MTYRSLDADTEVWAWPWPEVTITFSHRRYGYRYEDIYCFVNGVPVGRDWVVVGGVRIKHNGGYSVSIMGRAGRGEIPLNNGV